MSQPKIFIYRYLDTDEEENEDEDHDLKGELGLPRQGDLIYRRDKVWKVAGISVNSDSDPLRFQVLLLNMSRRECIN